MTVCKQTENGIRILHELPHRLRIRVPALYDPSFDPVYLEAVLLNLSGVEGVRFNLKAACIAIRYHGHAQTRERILLCLENIPTETFRPGIETEPVTDPLGLAFKGIIAVLLPVMPRIFQTPLSWTLALPTLAQGGNTLLTRGIKTDVLDATAVAASLLRKDYFTANAIIFLLAVGQYLEQTSEEQTNALLRSLLRPQSDMAWVERDGQEIQVTFDQVGIGDIVVCGSGEMIPVDGEVVQGDASVNQSSVTGESVPVHLQAGSQALSGTVVEEGRIKIRAVQVGTDTTTARISRFLENSLRFKSKRQRQSDRLADQLVPVTFGLGLITLLVTRDLRRAASVLAVDYSCAIKLASPVAVKMSMFTAAHCGVLLKGSQALDALARVDTLVFDKTGTLTRGMLAVTDVFPLRDMGEAELLALAAAAEAHYAHPVARAVIKAAKERKLRMPALSQVDFIVAHGVSAYVEGERVLVGSHHFISEDEGIDCSDSDDLAQTIRAQGKSLLYVARGDVLEGVIALRDELRPEAPQVLRQLKTLGIGKIVILTGDHQDTARALASQLDAADDVHWELKPEDKADIVRELMEAGCTLAFAGDGVNDAPALITADVGICMPEGADLARESAQVVLMKEDLNVLVAAKEIANKAEDIIHNCLISAVGGNSLFLLLALAGLLPPVASAMLHNATTVGIVGYAALAGKKPPTCFEKGDDACTHP